MSFPRVTAVLVLIGLVFAQSYQGRVELISSQRAGCRRGLEDRLERVAVLEHEHRPVPAMLRARVDPAHGGRLVCANAYPAASPLPRIWPF